MNLQAKVQMEPMGLYVHVPFCGTACDFCAFYQEQPKREDVEAYICGIIQEISELPDREVDTVFFGGGTPGLLLAKDFELIGRALLEKVGQKPLEWTVEMAPATVKSDKLLVMKDLGVTRVSMGVQSFNDGLLERLGRIHSSRQVYKAYECIQESGIGNVNLDLMFALPGQSMEEWEADMAEAVNLGPNHLSTYCLTFEEDTALWVKLAQGKVKRDEEVELAMYRRTWEYLPQAGYAQYEVSNFCRPGFECRHNINTWRMKDWVGVGPSASSQINGKRYTNVHNLNEWLEGVTKGRRVYVDESRLTTQELARDAVLFGLRMNEGVDIGEVEEHFGVSLEEDYAYLKDLEAEGYSERKGNRVVLTEGGRMVVDQIGQNFL